MTDETIKGATPPRGVFIHSDGKQALGIQLSGDISQLEAFALISLTLERLRKDLKFE